MTKVFEVQYHQQNNFNIKLFMNNGIVQEVFGFALYISKSS